MHAYSSENYPRVTSDVLSDVSEDDRSDANSDIGNADFPDDEGSDPIYEAEKKSSKPPPPARFRARVISLAQITENYSGIDTKDDDRILGVILKCRATADHPATPRPEAEAAIRTASRLMIRHHLTDGILLAKVPALEQNIGGQSTVRITSTKTDSKRVVKETWTATLADAVLTFFDCKAYFSTYLDRMKMDCTFYGVAQNTRLAAESFEWVHNLVLEWARGKGRSRNSYCLGVARELFKVARQDKARQEAEAKKHEREEMITRLKMEELEGHERLNRLRDPSDITPEQPSRVHIVGNCPPLEDKITVRAYHQEAVSDEVNQPDGRCLGSFGNGYDENTDTDSVDNDDNPDHYSDDSAAKILESFRPSTKPSSSLRTQAQEPTDIGESQATRETDICASLSSLTIYQTTAAKVADDFLEQEKIKLRKGRRRQWSIKDDIAYEDGRKDSRDIDIKRKRIEDVKIDKRDVNASMKRMRIR